jgi:hypothetical protein
MPKTDSKCKTPFGCPKWEWNYIPAVPDRKYCQSIVTAEEAKAGEKLIAAYRTEESVAAANDIEARQLQIDRLGNNGHGVEKQRLRSEITACDHGKYLAAQERLAALREEALQMITPILKRLAQSYDANLAYAALTGEQRLEKIGLPIKSGDAWAMHGDGVCQAIWSCRLKAEKALAELDPNSSIGGVQFFLTPEEHTPFNWP